jgi:hypothetical protein
MRLLRFFNFKLFSIILLLCRFLFRLSLNLRFFLFCSIFLRAVLVSIKFTDFSWGLTSFVFFLIRNVFLFFRLGLVQGLV